MQTNHLATVGTIIIVNDFRYFLTVLTKHKITHIKRLSAARFAVSKLVCVSAARSPMGGGRAA